MEACGTSHYRGRQLNELGHDVRLMSPAYVKPYMKRGKTDAGDAEAICEAVARPTMRFVPIKSPDQQAALALHRARDLLVRQRTQLVNMIRGLLSEFGITINRGLHHALELVTRIAGGATIEVPALAARVVAALARQVMELQGRLTTLERELRAWFRQNELAQQTGDHPRHWCRRGDRVRRHGDRPAALPLRQAVRRMARADAIGRTPAAARSGWGGSRRWAILPATAHRGRCHLARPHRTARARARTATGRTSAAQAGPRRNGRSRQPNRADRLGDHDAGRYIPVAPIGDERFGLGYSK